MRETLRLGLDQLEILDQHDSILQFRDVSSALDLLRRVSHDPVQMAMLRRIVAARCGDVHRLSTEQIQKRAGSLLVSGEIKILKSVWAGRSSAPASPQETSPQPAAAAPEPAKATSWIEINLRDASGQPVAGERYRIRLPDASVQEGVLNEFGHAEYYGVNRGDCQVSFPDLEDEDWEMA